MRGGPGGRGGRGRLVARALAHCVAYVGVACGGGWRRPHGCHKLVCARRRVGLAAVLLLLLLLSAGPLWPTFAPAELSLAARFPALVGRRVFVGEDAFSLAVPVATVAVARHGVGDVTRLQLVFSEQELALGRQVAKSLAAHAASEAGGCIAGLADGLEALDAHGLASDVLGLQL